MDRLLADARDTHCSYVATSSDAENEIRCKNMKKKTVIKRLQSLKSQLRLVGVIRLGLFGSTVRGENTAKSDIDILLDFNAEQETYPNFLDACQILENSFRRNKLDVVTLKGLSPYIGQTILSEVEYV